MLYIPACNLAAVDIHPADKNLPGGGLQQCIEMLDQARFPRTRMPQKPYHLAMRNFETDIIQSLFFKRRSYTVAMAEVYYFNVCHLSALQCISDHLCAGIHTKCGKRERKSLPV